MKTNKKASLLKFVSSEFLEYLINSVKMHFLSGLTFCLLFAYAMATYNCPACTRELNPVCGEMIQGGKVISCTFPNNCMMQYTSCARNQGTFF